MITLDDEGNIEDFESKSDLFGLGVFSKGSKNRIPFQTDNTYLADQQAKQAQQDPLAVLGSVLTAPFQLANNVLAGINNSVGKAIGKTTGNANGQATTPFPLPFPSPLEVINSNVGKTGKTGQAPTPLQFPPLPLFQLPIGKTEEDENDEDEAYERMCLKVV